MHGLNRPQFDDTRYDYKDLRDKVERDIENIKLPEGISFSATVFDAPVCQLHYDGLYPPETRKTYCCHSWWQWNGGQYECANCGPTRTALEKQSELQYA
jgi:hypothetical protein